MKFDSKILGFLLPIFFSSATLTGQNFEIKPQTYEIEGNKVIVEQTSHHPPIYHFLVYIIYFLIIVYQWHKVFYII